MKRLHRKQLKSDEFVTTFGIVLNFIKKWKREFKVGGVALLVAIFAFLCVQFVQSKTLKKQNILLGDIFRLSSELNESPEKIAELENLSGNGKYSRLGFLKLGMYWFEQGDFAKAIDQLNKISAQKKDLIYYQAQDLMAQIFGEQKNYDRAIEIYETIEKQNPDGYSLEAVLFHKAEALEDKGDMGLALAVYKKIQEDFPQTYYGMDASTKVMELEEKK
ncbi:MAG: tetratricopeptide repeat protein [Candidatus Aminicenantes bacterium]|nr:tetratricopeptide repeat protein [Candidatus Aminicenantes bacterium]